MTVTARGTSELRVCTQGVETYTENERLIKAAVARLMMGRATLVIAHRLSTILSANRVVMIDRGQVVASGHHADLVAGTQGMCISATHRTHCRRSPLPRLPLLLRLNACYYAHVDEGERPSETSCELCACVAMIWHSVAISRSG